MAEVGRAVPSAPQALPGALDYYMRKSAQSAKIFGTPPERGHSCPQQLPNTQRDRNVRELYFRSTLLRTGMSALLWFRLRRPEDSAPYHQTVWATRPYVVSYES